MWTIDDSASLYGVEGWGNGYFTINDAGNLTVSPRKGNGGTVEVMEIVDRINEGGVVSFPILFRFPQIIEDRLEEINGAFLASMEELEYGGGYRLVFPMKVNQRKEVVEYIVKGGERLNVGLEVGTKAELLAALSLGLGPDALIVCNGYKDQDYLKLALTFGESSKIVIVIDIFEEIFDLLRCSKELGIKPRLGLRTKLFSRGSGRWEESGGELSKFGLSTAEILESIRILSENGMIDRLEMLHFHIGSQITDIRKIKIAMNEAARIYAKVRKVAEVEYFNVGGGLSVDYDGSKTPTPASANYTLQEYSNDIVYTLQRTCDEEEVPCPTIVSESGRAIAAYHSFLAFKVIGKKNSKEGLEVVPAEDDPVQIEDMRQALDNMDLENYAEFYHDALHYREELFDAFNLGNIGLEERSKGDLLFWKVCQKAASFAKADENDSEEFESLKKLLSKKYIGNFSLFQSVPDMWGVQQIFPTMPLHRLGEEPTVRGTIADITCDSDGEIRSFAGENSDFLALHHLLADEDYYLGTFLLGAYQDTLGDFHNLLGCVNEVHIKVDDGGWRIAKVVQGDACGKLLRFFNYETEEGLGETASRCCADQAERERAMGMIRKALGEYSYFKNRYLRG
ncbi:biosynthetic arginine decarboxylase [Methanocrinis sp.]|uniref:biosynthetic arginine decarboxylase n=1 Tax=Methanocrinis sp. TaxID=3101522 RepID=UPI003D0ABD61